MKKTILAFAALLLFGSVIRAQPFYNKTYYNTSPSAEVLKPVDHVNAQSNGSSVMLAKCEETGSIGTKLVLTKFDDAGTILFQRLWKTNITEAQIRPDKLILTGDNGFIVVGSVYSDGNTNPFAAKFTSNGDHTAMDWASEYVCNTGSWDEGRTPKVNIVKVQGSSDEYIIVANGKPVDPSVQTSYPQDAVITALRINGNTGNVIWANKYGMPFAMRTGATAPFGYHSLPGGTPPLNMITNMPHALANGNGKSFIAGSVDWGIQYGLGYLGFYMAINDDGTVNQDYNFMNTWSPSEHNAIFDDLSDGTLNPKFILSYNSGNTSSLPGYQGAYLQKFTAPGIITPDMVGGLPVADYYTEGGDEFYAMGLDKRYDGLHYVLSSWSRVSESGAVGIPGMMMIDKIPPAPSLPPAVTGYNKFDVLNPSRFNNVITMLALPDYSMTQERYVLFNKVTKSGKDGVRMTSADGSLQACGYKPSSLLLARVNSEFSPLPQPRTNILHTLTIKSLTLVEQAITNDYDNCDWTPFAGDYYRKAQPMAADLVNLYPTLLQADQQTITLDIQIADAATLEIKIVGMNGAVIQRQQFQGNKGSQQFQLSIPTIAPGQYMVNVNTADGKINKHVLITKL